MRTTVEELHNRPIEEILIEHNMKKQLNQPTQGCDNYINSIYKFRWQVEAGYNIPQFSIMMI